MNFGESLRKAREAQGWSRYRLAMAIRERFQSTGTTIGETTIKDIETGKISTPRETTRRKLLKIFPEIA